MEEIRILAINPGSTSTKIAVYIGTNPVFIQTIRHSKEEIEKYDRVTDQFQFRKDLILKELKDADIRIDLIRVVMGRGGVVKPVESGVFEVNEKMLYDLRECVYGEHASNLGGLIAGILPIHYPMPKPTSPTRWWLTNWKTLRVFRVILCCRGVLFFMRLIKKQLPVSMPNPLCESTRS